MSESEPVGQPQGEAATTTAPTVEAKPEPQPEPWTPQRVAEWNAYYDLYVMLGVLLLTFAVSANKITNSSIWTQLRAGQTIAAQGAPLVTDPFSFTEQGQRWVNIPWLFEWSQAGLYKLASGLVPRDPGDPAASAAKADQVGAGTLVAVNALVRVLAALVLLSIRRRGPGLWWSAVCVTLALGVIYSPAGLMLGGIALPGQVSPGTWGLLFLAIELLLIHRATAFGRPGAIWGLVPLFLLWANVDESFLLGLMVLAAAVVGLLDRAPVDPKPAEDDDARPAPGFGRGLAVLAVCAAVCLVNPSVHRVFSAAFTPFLTHFQPKTDARTLEQLSFFSPSLREDVRAGGAWRGLVGFYLIAVGVGLFSFVLNRRRFALGRFLMFALAAVLWGYLIRYSGEFAVVFAVTLALNGQEWYHDRCGTQGRLGRGWALWSTGGRALTIVVVFLVVARALTGYGSALGDLQFGFGYDPDNFEFEAAEFLKNAPIKGRVLNTTRHQGDALVWRGYPQRPTFVDNRHNLFPQSLLNELQQIRTALKTNEKDAWKPLLDKYQISAVMLDISSSPVTYQALMQTPDWIPFYDDGNVVLFGRSDADVPAEDLAYFKANRLDAETMAYKLGKTVPSPERPPTQVTWMDQIFTGKSISRLQPHSEAAKRWLQGMNFDAPGAPLPTPAQCLLAIREARTALSHKPDDYQAFRILSECYRALMIQEAALIQGIKLTPENTAQLAQGGLPNPLLVMTRYRQRATALNFAIQTTPPPRTPEERQILRGLNLELFRHYIAGNFNDLARDRLQQALEIGSADLNEETRAAFTQQLNQLNEVIKQIQDGMNDLSITRQAGPLERAGFAIQNGAPGLAIQELEEADRTNLSPALVKPQLLDLYSDTGQPEKAAEVLGAGSPDDPSLGGEPGLAALRQGQVYFLLGNYEDASLLWDKRAIQQLRFDRSERALSQLQTFLRGIPKPSVNTLVTIPSKLATQASWEYDLGLCLLEAGAPELAAEHFTKALELVPDLQPRRLIAYYLEKLGKPVPPSASERQAEENKKAEKEKPKTDEKPKADEKPNAEEKKVEEKPKADEKPKAEEKKADEKPKAEEPPAAKNEKASEPEKPAKPKE